MDLMDPKTVVVTRPTRTDDNAGGFVAGTPAAVGTWQADVIIPRVQDSQRDEEAPGIQTVRTRVFMFVDSPQPGILVNDLLAVGGEVFVAKWLESFDDNLQVWAWANE